MRNGMDKIQNTIASFKYELYDFIMSFVCLR